MQCTLYRDRWSAVYSNHLHVGIINPRHHGVYVVVGQSVCLLFCVFWVYSPGCDSTVFVIWIASTQQISNKSEPARWPRCTRGFDSRLRLTKPQIDAEGLHFSALVIQCIIYLGAVCVKTNAFAGIMYMYIQCGYNYNFRVVHIIIFTLQGIYPACITLYVYPAWV